MEKGQILPLEAAVLKVAEPYASSSKSPEGVAKVYALTFDAVMQVRKIYHLDLKNPDTQD